MPLRIPSSYVEIYMWLAKLDDASAKELVTAFGASGNLSRDSLIKSVNESTGHEVRRLRVLFDSMLGLLRTIQDSEEAVEAAAPSDVANDPQLELDDDERLVLKDRVRELVSCRSIQMIAKAVDLQSDHTFVFRSARIYSEIRPMFEKDLSEPPRAAALTHKLKLEYYDSNLDTQAMYIALDSEDLRLVLKVFERELEKLSTIDATLDRAGIVRNSFEEDE